MTNFRRWGLALGAAALATLAVGITTVLWMKPTQAAQSGSAAWGENYFPNVRLVAHDGRTLRFFDDLLKDKVVAINFIFTSCSATCPLETARLREVQRLLGDRVGKDVFFYSISIDPLNDTPETLKAYAEKFQIGPGWLFLTGKEADITLLRQTLGLFNPDPRIDPNDHNVSLIIGNQTTGQWMKTSPFENPYIMATRLGSWLHNWKIAEPRGNSYENAPALRQIGRGEDLFRTRCTSCHSLGEALDPTLAAVRKLGPDLTGVVTRRERAWLHRWLKEPDRMLREKDPIAIALKARYNDISMPNLQLEDVEVKALLDYIAERSEPVATGGARHPPTGS